MNILADDLPRAVEVAGEVFSVAWDYRTCLKIIMAYEDPELTEQEKVIVMLELFYPERIPDDVDAAARMAVKFLDCGKERSEGAQGSPEPRYYSFTHDAGLIYSAIRQRFGVDLAQSGTLHWWTFSNMFMDLDPDCLFHRVINLRRGYARGTLNKDERAAYAALRDLVELPIYNTAVEQAAVDEFMAQLNGG